MAEGRKVCVNARGDLPSSSSPLPSACYSSFQTWLPVGSRLWPLWTTDHQEQDSRDRGTGTQLNELPSTNFYEELACTSQSSAPLLPLSGDHVMTACGPQGDVVKQGSLGKLERNQKRYFVLRAGSHAGPSRLEWYKNQEKFTITEKSAGKPALLDSSRQGVIYLRCCLGVSRIGSSRKGHTVALYTKNQTMVLMMEDQQEQDEWYQSIRKLMEEERKNEEHGEELEEEDDGYCTLPAAAFYKEVWPVTVKPRGLGRSKSLAGETRLCLTATSLVLVPVCSCTDLPSVTIPLLSVRRFGHLDGSFFLELGRSAPNGPGEIWMEAQDQGNSEVAQNIHEVIREAVRALRALPDFSRTPTFTNSHPQTLVVSKRRRPRCRDKCLSVKPLDTPLARPCSNPVVIQSSPKLNRLEPCDLDNADPDSTLTFTSRLWRFRTQQSSTSDTDSYVEMKTEQSNVSGWELSEEGERQGYVVMSPQLSHMSSKPEDDYVIMCSPHKHGRSVHSSSSSLQTFNSSTDGCSPLHPSHRQTSVRQWEAQEDQSQIRTSSIDAAQTLAQQPAQTSSTSPPGLGLIAPPDLSVEAVYTRSVQGSADWRTDQPTPLQAAQFKPARRHRLSFCLPACLQAGERS